MFLNNQRSDKGSLDDEESYPKTSVQGRSVEKLGSK